MFCTLTHSSNSFKVCILLFLLIGISRTNSIVLAQQTAVPVLDLRAHDFNQNQVVETDTNWAFYWNKILSNEDIPQTVPDTLLAFTTNWATINNLEEQGYATYALSILLPDNHPPLALDIPDFYSAYELYIGGEFFSANGTVATTKERYEPKWLPLTKPLSAFRSDTLTLILQVANFDHSKGGAYLPIKIGDADKLFRDRYISYGYSFILTGILLMAGLFFLGVYLFGRREISILFFAAFCLVYSYRIIGFGSYAFHMLLPELPWIFTLRIEYVTLFLSGLLFGLYTLYLYPRETSKPMIYVLSAISILFMLESIFLSPSIFTQLVIPYFILLIFYLIVAFYVYIRAVINKRPGAIYSLISSGAIFVVFGYEILVYMGLFTTSLFLNFAGYLFFFFFQSLVHSFRYSTAMRKALHRAEESSRAKSQFLSTMSHEIRTPLNAVIGLSGLLADSNLNARQLEFAGTIKKSGENLLGIINNILDFSKIESGKLEIEDVEFKLREVIENVLDVVASSKKKQHLEIVYSVSEEIPPYVTGDASRIQQVLTNLLANAIKFTEHGEILLSVHPERVFSDSMVLRFEVHDTGIGISEDKMHRLFQSFTQVDASSTRKYGGTGLGLVISKRLVEAMGGTIWVSSTIEEGTTFYFTIPFGLSHRVEDFKIPSILENKKVFLLDDNETNLRILQHQLKKAHLKVSTFNNPKMLLSSLPELKDFDFGILDMQMPEVDGVAVARAIRKHYSSTDLSLVLLSSIHELGSHEDKSLFELFLKKPIQQTRFLNNLERLFTTDFTPSDSNESDDKHTKLFQTDFKVLIAEDNVVNQKVAFRILERMGIQSDIVENGKQAVDAVLSTHYDVIFMDMEMPEMDGLEATQIIKNLRLLDRTTPIIVAMTANALQEDRERCFEAGMDDFIAKPISLELTRKMLIKWLADDLP